MATVDSGKNSKNTWHLKKNYTVILSGLEKMELKIHEPKLKIDKN